MESICAPPPWLALWPGLCLTLVVYSLNMFGDAMRDLLDPRLRGGGRLGANGTTSVQVECYEVRGGRRTRRPGSAPVSSSCSSTISPPQMV